MPTAESKYEMKRMVLSELGGLCKKLSESSAITDEQRTRISQFVTEFDSLTPMIGKGITAARFEGQQLLLQIARYLPQLVDDYDPDVYLDRAS